MGKNKIETRDWVSSQRATLWAVSQILGHSDIKVTHEFYSFWEETGLVDRHRLGRLE